MVQFIPSAPDELGQQPINCYLDHCCAQSDKMSPVNISLFRVTAVGSTLGLGS